MSYHGSSLALSPVTLSWWAWIKQEARTHLNVLQIFTSKTQPRPYFLHFVQHMSNCSTKKSPVIRTDNQPTETHLDTKKLKIPLFFFLLSSSSHFWWMPAFKEQQVLSRGFAFAACMECTGRQLWQWGLWTLWMAPLTFSARNKVSLYTQTSPSSPLKEAFEKIFNFHGNYP